MMTSLLGIALVVDDINKGCNLAFRYPAPPATLDHVSSFHKLGAPLLAKLFRPKNALCNQCFELTIDGLRFISHPVLVPRRVQQQGNGPMAASGGAGSVGTAQVASASIGAAVIATAMAASSASMPVASKTHAHERDTTMFNVIFALDEQPSLYQPPGEDQTHPAGGVEKATKLRCKQSIASFRTVAAQLANGLLHEELRAGFVSREVRELLHIRDELVINERQPVASSGSTSGGTTSGVTGGNGGSAVSGSASAKDNAGSGEGGHASVDIDPQTLVDVSLGKSVLASDLKGVFHGLNDSGTAHVVINRWVKLSLTLTDSGSLKMQNLRPYQTLLLLADEAAILHALPGDHSHQLRVLIAAANPLRSFQDLALETSIPIHQLFRLSAHLSYWGYGRVIDTITMHNIYQVHKMCSLRSLSARALEFRRKFPPHELSEVLSSFNGARRVGEYVKTLSSGKKAEYISMLIWLLQRDFVIQLHRFVYFMIPSEHDIEHGEENHTGSTNGRSRRSESGPSATRAQKLSDSSADTAELALSKPSPPASTIHVGLTEEERSYLDKIATTNPVFTLFKRLCVYFHGQYHLEEIMWRENVSRSELRTVLSTYQGIIVCCLHE